MSNIKDYLVTVRTTNDASPTATLVMLGNDVLFKLDNNDPIPVSGETVAQSSENIDYTGYTGQNENFFGESPLQPPLRPPQPPISESQSASLLPISESQSASLPQPPISASGSASGSALRSALRSASRSRSGSASGSASGVIPAPREKSPFRTGNSNNTRTGGRVNKTGKKIKRKPRTKTLKR